MHGGRQLILCSSFLPRAWRSRASPAWAARQSPLLPSPSWHRAPPALPSQALRPSSLAPASLPCALPRECSGYQRVPPLPLEPLPFLQVRPLLREPRASLLVLVPLV